MIEELVGFQVGVRESTQSWRELLVEVKRRGLTIAPEIAVGDGALGFSAGGCVIVESRQFVDAGLCKSVRPFRPVRLRSRRR